MARQERSGSFTAEAILESLRAGRRPSNDEAARLNALPLIDKLRSAVRESDVPWLLKEAERGSGGSAALCLSLLRSFSARPDVHQRLLARWRTANAFMRAHLMWRILDAKKLPRAWHDRLFRFTLNEWDTFQKVSAQFIGPPDMILGQVLRRLGDPSFPDSKRWAYLCRLPEAAADQPAARALITIIQSSSDAFTRKVASALMRRFYAT